LKPSRGVMLPLHHSHPLLLIIPKMVRRRMGGGWERGRIIQGNAKSRFGRAKLIDLYGDAVHHGRASYGAYLIGVHLTGVYLNAAFGGRWCFISHFGAKWQLGTLCPCGPPHPP
jgi:hypothetical protein